jgi:23S rRNA pseudouridine1911/1915/1917 synthase
MTRVETISEVPGYALLRVLPQSGRTHQIRIHLSSIGCSVVGDKLYGMSEEKYLAWRGDPHRFAEPLEFPRQALHCMQMTFQHPNTGVKTVIHAPVPADMMELIRKLNLSKSAL